MGVTEIISETPITREEIEAAMKDTGYKIFFVLGAFVFFLVLEFVMMGAFQAVGSTKTKRVLRTLCQAFLVILIVGYILLVGMSLFIGGDLLLQGEMSKGISVLLFSVIIAVCVYVWLIRGWIKHIKQMKNR